MSNNENKLENLELSIENYIKDEYSICREERQYALFLYNILRAYKKNDITDIYEACGIPTNAEILNVFYEATFMRDIFERNRRIVLGLQYLSESKLSDEDKKEKLKTFILNKKFSPENYVIEDPKESFNARLLEYLNEKNRCKLNHNSKEYNLGGKKIKCNRERHNCTLAKSMMNSKPDIAVIYEEDRQKYLHFIECKFESGEDKDKAGNKQTVIQWHIAEFLCNNYFNGLNVSKTMNKESCLVQFDREAEKTNKNIIPIKTLIELNDEIFKNPITRPEKLKTDS